jgi:crotonobetainyl-CoA:carnitine CoA-transferase CaiB-like acyl-CoA transferase
MSVYPWILDNLKATKLTILKPSDKTIVGIRILSVALNLPGPAALMRLADMGAKCTKLEPLSPAGIVKGTSTDPMGMYAPHAYAQLHRGVKVLQADLKTDKGQVQLHKLLAQTDVLLTSFRPSALKKLGLSWADLHDKFPALNMVSIVGSAGAVAEIPGHDLTYLAAHDLVTSLNLPATLFADMAGSLQASEAVLKVLWQRGKPGRSHGKGVFHEVALEGAAAYLALPRQWGLTTPKGSVGGAHAGYAVYLCKNGRVAVAALEPHFAARLAQVAGLPSGKPEQNIMLLPKTKTHLTAFFATLTRKQVDAMALANDLPLHTMR